jgi:hypothetical protein
VRKIFSMRYGLGTAVTGSGGSPQYGSDKFIPSKDMIHIMEPGINWNNTGRFYGYAPLFATSIMVDLEANMLRQLWHRFQNFAPPGLVFTPDKDVMPGGFDEDAMRNIYSWIATQHSLAQDSYAPMVLPAGVDVKNVAMTPKEMDYMESLDKALEYILAVFSTPKAAVGLVSDFNRNNYGAAMQAWADNMLNPLLLHMSQHLTQDLAREYGEDLAIIFPKVETTDLNLIRAWMDMMIRNEVMSIPEARDVAVQSGIASLEDGMPQGATIGDVQADRKQAQMTQQAEIEDRRAEQAAAHMAAAQEGEVGRAKEEPKGQPQKTEKRSGRGTPLVFDFDDKLRERAGLNGRR